MTDSKRCTFYDVLNNLTFLNDQVFKQVRPVKDMHRTTVVTIDFSLYAILDLVFKQVRPVKDMHRTTVVTIDFSLYAILDLDMKSQSLKTFGWFDVKWKNEYLTWDPNNFCGVSRIAVGKGSVWTPDYFVYEMTDKDHAPKIGNLYISNDGTNFRSEPMLIVSTCGMDTLRFPFDTQNCRLTLGSNMHTVDDIYYKAESNSSVLNNISNDIFASKGDWNLLYIDVENRNLSLNGVNYSQIEYQIIMKRTPRHYVVTLIAPACFLVLIDFASMFIPIDGGERLGFKITLVLGFSVLLLILHDLLPNAHGTPMLELFCMECLVLMVCSAAECIFISYLLKRRSTVQLPRWIKILVLKHLARALCIDTKAKEGNEGRALRKTSSLQNTASLTGKAESTEAEILMGILMEMVKIRQALNSLKNEEGRSECYMVAFVFDRLFFLLYVIFFFIVLFVVIYFWSG